MESGRKTFDAEHIPGARVVVYDQSNGFWATRLWWHLRLEGFDDVEVLDGGLNAWKAAGHPVTDKPSPAPAPCTYQARRRPEPLRSTEEVHAALDDPRTVLVNVLDPQTYARAGHIPGSTNLPVSEVTDPEAGTLKSAEELRTLFADKGLLDGGDHTGHLLRWWHRRHRGGPRAGVGGA